MHLGIGEWSSTRSAIRFIPIVNLDQEECQAFCELVMRVQALSISDICGDEDAFRDTAQKIGTVPKLNCMDLLGMRCNNCKDLRQLTFEVCPTIERLSLSLEITVPLSSDHMIPFLQRILDSQVSWKSRVLCNDNLGMLYLYSE